MRSAECQGERRERHDLSWQFRIPHSALCTRFVTHTTFQVGRLRCHALEGGHQHLDGGAMFGVVPKPLWERRIPADARNRIPLALRCLLVEHDGGLVLIDTGLGNKESDKFRDIYGVENAGAGGPTPLQGPPAAPGHPAEARRGAITPPPPFHHARGGTFRDGDGAVRPGFPPATYVVQRREPEVGPHTNEGTAPRQLPHK